jgi:hypothetical protein
MLGALPVRVVAELVANYSEFDSAARDATASRPERLRQHGLADTIRDGGPKFKPLS